MMNIFVVSNDAYYPRLKVFARSLVKHNTDQVFLTVLFSELSPDSRADFCDYSKELGIVLRMFPVSEKRSEKYKLIHHITVETYYRFLLLDVFPNEERALWMDIDTVIIGDITPFYYDNFDDNYVIACPGNHEKDHLARLGLNPEGCYFNAGVILFNLNKIRQDFAPDFLYNIYEQYEEVIKFSDQDVLNIAFAGKIKKEPDRRYNFIVTSGQKYSLKEMKTIKNKCAVIHYIRHIKPWQYYYQGKIKYFYFKEMFPLYPFQTVLLVFWGMLYKFKINKKTLENSVK